MHEEFIDFIREISKEAGIILLRGFRSDKTVISYKSRTDLVTDADKASEAFLVDRISKRFPDHITITV